jgi:hypothetical protein
LQCTTAMQLSGLGIVAIANEQAPTVAYGH